MNNARNAEIRRQRCYENNCPDRRQNPNGTTRNTPIAEWGACRRTCLEEFPYTPYELEMQRREAAAAQRQREAAAARAAASAARAAVPAAASAQGPTPGGGKNRKSRKTRRRSIRR